MNFSRYREARVYVPHHLTSRAEHARAPQRTGTDGPVTIDPLERLIQSITRKGTFLVERIGSGQLGSSKAVNCRDLPVAGDKPTGERMKVDGAETTTGSVTDIKRKLITRGIRRSCNRAPSDGDCLAGITKGIIAALQELKVSKKLELAAQEIDVMKSEVDGVQVQATLVRIRNRGTLDKCVRNKLAGRYDPPLDLFAASAVH